MDTSHCFSFSKIQKKTFFFETDFPPATINTEKALTMGLYNGGR